MKILGAFMFLIGLVAIVFALLAYSELRTAATSATAPSADSMPLTRIVCPELFDTQQSAMKPADLARMAFRRLYLIGGASIFAMVVGTLMIIRPSKTPAARRDDAEPT